MRLLRIVIQRLRSLLQQRQVDEELARELTFHLEHLEAELVNEGLTRAEAKLAARRALGNVPALEEECRDHRRTQGLIDGFRDLGYAARTLAKAPWFAALGVMTLAFGVGASLAVYALAEALWSRSLPYPEPERLVRLAEVDRNGHGGFVSQANFRDWRAASDVFERMAFAEMTHGTFTGTDDPERVEGRAVSEEFFGVLGVQPQRGRTFVREEHQPGAACVLVASHGLWLRRWGGSADAVGRPVTMNDRPCVVVGVMPPGFRFSEAGSGVAEYWTPVSVRTLSRLQHQYAAYARLKPGVSLVTAQEQMNEISRRLAREYLENEGWSAQVRSLREDLWRPVRSPMVLFGGAALMVWLTGCANVASLLLARGTGRSREIAVRLALGAGRWRVVRLLLAEGLWLAALASLLGVLLAGWLLRLATLAAPPALQLGEMLTPGYSLVAFAVGFTMVTALVASGWPALRASRVNLERGLKQARSLSGLVVLEVALAVALLGFSGVLAKSFLRLWETKVGYRTDQLLTFQLTLPDARYPTPASRRQFWEALLERVRQLPGVESAAASDSIPLGGTLMRAPMAVEGQPSPRNPWDLSARGALVTPDYFRTLGLPLRAGRYFNLHDEGVGEPAVVVNEAFVRQLLRDRPAIGTRVRMGQAPWARIVGVIGDTRYFGPAEKAVQPEAYFSYTLAPQLQFVSLHVTSPEAAVLNDLRRVVRELDASLPIIRARTMRQAVDDAIAIERQMMLLVTGFGLVTLMMATTGLFGMLAFTVSRRQREIGVRMALGARPADIAWEVLRSAGRLLAWGAGLGMLLAMAAGRGLASWLHAVRADDPWPLMAAAGLLVTVGLLAGLIPARRAATVEPMLALRIE